MTPRPDPALAGRRGETLMAVPSSSRRPVAGSLDGSIFICRFTAGACEQNDEVAVCAPLPCVVVVLRLLREDSSTPGRCTARSPVHRHVQTDRSNEPRGGQACQHVTPPFGANSHLAHSAFACRDRHVRNSTATRCARDGLHNGPSMLLVRGYHGRRIGGPAAAGEQAPIVTTGHSPWPYRASHMDSTVPLRPVGRACIALRPRAPQRLGPDGWPLSLLIGEPVAARRDGRCRPPVAHSRGDWWRGHVSLPRAALHHDGALRSRPPR